ncbi:MAG: hypothetical protein ABFS10_15655, partial [Bacteroidota bacterium]
MKDSLNSGRGFLKEKMGGYQVAPPASVWSAISGRVGGRRRRGLVISVVAAAASIALAITLGISYFAPDLPDRSDYSSTIDEEQPRKVNAASDQEDATSNQKDVPSHQDDAEPRQDDAAYYADETESRMAEAELRAVDRESSARSQRIARRESLEEKVVQAMGDVAEVEAEAFPYEIGAPSISEVKERNKPLQGGLTDGKAAGEVEAEDVVFQTEVPIAE